jgi:hypothetical protein
LCLFGTKLEKGLVNLAFIPVLSLIHIHRHCTITVYIYVFTKVRKHAVSFQKIRIMATAEHASI